MPVRPVAPARLALAAAVAVAAMAGCGGGDRRCPGDPVGKLVFTGTRDLAPDPLTPSIPACGPETGAWPDSVAFSGILSEEEETGGAAFCPAGSHAQTLYGTRSGDVFAVTGEVPGAVLAGCGPQCEVRLTAILSGTWTPAADGAAASFEGTWTERLESTGGDCSLCALPCDGRYDVTGAPAP